MFTDKEIKVIIASCIIALILVLITSCRSAEKAVARDVEYKTEYRDKWHRDSVFVLDSVMVKMQADTVFVTKWKYVYRNKLQADSVFIERIDTVNSVVEVERDFTASEKIWMKSGKWLLPWFLLFCVAVLCYFSNKFFGR